MSVPLLTRTVIVAAYLLALLFKGRADLATAMVAVSVAAVWAVALWRDRVIRGGGRGPARGDTALRVR